MAQETTCRDPQTRDLVEGYVGGALDAAEQARFERHLAGCAHCRAQVTSYAPVVAALPQALASASAAVHLPPTLRERVLRTVSETALPQPAAEDSRPSSTVSPPPSAVRLPPSVSMWRQTAGRRVAALATAAAGVLAIGWGVQQGVALARERSQLRAEYAALVSQQETVLEVVDARNTVKRQLAPPTPPANPATAPYGKLYTRPDLPQVVAMAGRLPSAPAGQAYQLWVSEQGQTRLAGTLAFNQGFGLVVYDADHPGPAYDAAWITVQPAGSTAPTGPTVLQWHGP